MITAKINITGLFKRGNIHVDNPVGYCFSQQLF